MSGIRDRGAARSAAGGPILFAHRGAMALAPENTIEAFRLAIELGATGLESDVHLAADGTPVLVHDPVVRVPAGRVVVREASVTQLRALGIPTLADLYAATGPAWPLSLDLNDERTVEAAEAVIACARAAGPAAVAALRLCHEHLPVLADIARRAPDVALVHSTELEVLPELGRHARSMASHGIAVLNLHHRGWLATGSPRRAIAAIHAAGCRAFAWDTQEVATARAMLEAGIDGVYANDPRVLVTALAPGGRVTAGRPHEQIVDVAEELPS